MRKIIGTAALIVVAILSASEWIIDGHKGPNTFIYILCFFGTVTILENIFNMKKKARIKALTNERSYTREGVSMLAIEVILELPYYKEDGTEYTDAIVAVRHVKADEKPLFQTWLGSNIEVTLAMSVREHNGKYYQNATITKIQSA